MRWKALIPTVLILAALAVFTVFFLDGFVERAIESLGTKANGAKVELDGVDVKLASLSVTLKHLQVTDKDNPMTNALEVESLKFDVAAKPLTWKKVIIETGEINGIRTGTPRKTSGAIPRAAQEEDEEEVAESTAPSKAAEMAKEAASFAMENLKEQYDPKKLIQPENLASYKKIQEEQTRITRLSEEWEKKVDGLQVNDKADQIKDFVNRAKNEKFSGLEGVKKAKDYLDEAKKYRDDAKNLKQAVGDLKTALQKEFAAAKDSLKEIDKLKGQDYESSLAQLKSGAFSAEGISRGLIGPEWFAKVQKGLGLFHKVRRMIPQKKEGAKPPPPPPRTGRDIPFPFKYNWPAFHWKKAQLSGTTSGDKAIQYKGTLTDVTSDPKLVGKPMALDIAGRRAEGPEKLALRAEFDYTKDTPREKLAAKYSGMKLAGTSLGKVGEPVTIGDGSGVIATNLEVRGDNIGGDIKFTADPVRLEQPITPALAANRLYGILHDVLIRLNKLDVTILVSNTLRSPKFDLQTTLDNQIKDAVNQVLKKELEELKAQFKARVNELVDEQRKKLADLIESKTGVAAGKLNSKEGAVAALQEQLDKLQDDLKKKGQEALPVQLPGQSGDSGNAPKVPDLKNIFKKR